MKTQVLKFLGLILIASFTVQAGFSQQSSGKAEKEIIIIERTVDKDGNEISRTITRRNGNDISDEEMEELMDEGRLPGSFGFGDSGKTWKRWKIPFAESFKTNGRPTIGLTLSFEGDRAVVSDVTAGSDAAEEDIRVGDLLVSINRVPISSFEDVTEALEGREAGEEVDVIVFRDGEEIEKQVELRVNRFGEMGFTFPEGWGESGFYFDFGDQGDLRLFTDSIIRQMEMDGLMPDLRSWDSPQSEREETVSEKGQLGVFIEDTPEGVVITEVVAESPAEVAGLKPGDVIVRINGREIASFRELAAIMDQKAKGETLLIEIDRDRSMKEIEVKLN